MYYVTSYLAGKHYNLVRFALFIRWLIYLLVSHPITTVSIGASLWFMAWPIAAVGLILDIFLGLIHQGYSTWRQIIKFMRSWPVTWATIQKVQVADYDDGYKIRPFWSCPRLGWFFKRDHKEIIFKVTRPYGGTLEDLQKQQTALAAQYHNVASIAVDYNTQTSSKGTLKLLLTNAESKPKTEKIPQAQY